ncbi:MAG TPA: hypothetical protein VGK06_03535 [Methanosarcina sp.]|jgi:hypothetical protein
MYEEFGTVLNKGFKSWIRNLNICIPFVLNFLVELILYFLFFGLIGILVFTSSTGSIIDPSTLSDKEIFAMIWGGFSNNIILSVSLLLGFFLSFMFVQSFFTAGAIGMAKKALETGDTVLSDMVASGSKNVFRFFMATLLIALILLVGIIFMVPGALSVGNLNALLQNPEASMQGMSVLATGIILWTVYLIIVNLALSLSTYALVIDELGPLEALSAGFKFFMDNKLDVFFIWVIYIGLALIIEFIGEFTGSQNIMAASSLIMVVFLKPLMTVLWTRLYLTREGKKLYNPSDLLSYPDRF